MFDLLLIISISIFGVYGWDPKCVIPAESGCDAGTKCKYFDPIKGECQINKNKECELPYGDVTLDSEECRCGKSLCGETFCASIPDGDPCYWLDDTNDIQECNNDMDCVIAFKDTDDNFDWDGSFRSRCVDINYFKCDCDNEAKAIKKIKNNARGWCVPTCNFFTTNSAPVDPSCSSGTGTACGTNPEPRPAGETAGCTCITRGDGMGMVCVVNQDNPPCGIEPGCTNTCTTPGFSCWMGPTVGMGPCVNQNWCRRNCPNPDP